MVSGRASRAAAALATLVGVYLAGTGAVYLRPPGGPVATWWPAAGLAVALLALTPRRWWPVLTLGVVASVTAANLSGGRELDLSVMFGVANAAEALVAAAVLTHGGRTAARFRSLDDLLRLIRAAVLGAAVAATGLAFSSWILDEGSFVEVWRTVIFSHAASILLVAAAATGWRRDLRVQHRGELVVQSVGLGVVTWFTFAPSQNLPLAFASFPLLVWAALRFDLRVVLLQLLAVSATGTVATAQGLGPFAGAVEFGFATPAEAGTMVQIWLVSAAALALPMTVAVSQRRDLLADLTARELLWRRNFTDSATGMLLLEPRGDRLEIVDANTAALRIVGESQGPLVGSYLDRVLDNPVEVRRQVGALLSGEQGSWHTQAALAESPETRVDVALSQVSGGTGPVFSAQLRDVTVQHEARTRIEAAERLTSATLDTTAALILVTDVDGTVVRVNRAACQLTGWSEDQLLGHPLWARIVAPERVEPLQQLFRDTRGAGIDRTRETDVPTADGGRLRVLWSNDLVTDDAGEPAYVVLTGQDVTAERRAAGLVQHLLQASVTTLLVGLDPEGRITMANSGAQRLLGWESAELVGRPFLDLLDRDQATARTGEADEAAIFEALTAELGDRGETAPRDWTCVGADGARLTLSLTFSATAETAGGGRGYLCVGRDVTEQRQNQELLIAALEKERTAVERLRRLDSAKNEFVSTVSHELRTPVTSIIGYTELLQDGSVAEVHPDQLPLLATIARNGERLITICNDLLMLGGLDSGAAAWERERFDLRSLLPHLEDAVRPLVHGRRLEVAYDAPEQALPVLGDRIQLERAMLNLLGNAVKFTEDGGSVACRMGRDGDEAVVTVSDTGIGIPVEEQDELFTKFFRSSTAQQRAIPGTGLGLSIVSGIVTAHGGRVDVTSAHLQGTTFTVRLPLTP